MIYFWFLAQLLYYESLHPSTLTLLPGAIIENIFPSSQGMGLKIFLKQRGRSPDSYKHFSSQMSRKCLSVMVFLSQQLCIKLLLCTWTMRHFGSICTGEKMGQLCNTEPQVCVWQENPVICCFPGGLLQWAQNPTLSLAKAFIIKQLQGKLP